MIKIRQFIDSYTISRVTKLDSRDSPLKNRAGNHYVPPSLPPHRDKRFLFLLLLHQQRNYTDSKRVISLRNEHSVLQAILNWI